MPLLAALVSGAVLAGPPPAEATLSADGHYVLLLRADEAWAAAEVKVDGDGALDLGAVPAGEAVRVEGWVDEPGPLAVRVAAATPDDRGLTWRFFVDPDLVPVASPVPAARRVPWWRRLLGGRRR